MGKTKGSDTDDRESRQSFSQRQLNMLAERSPPYSFSRPQSQLGSYSPHGTSFFAHPCAHSDNATDDQHEKSIGNHLVTRSKPSSRSGDKVPKESRPATPASATPSIENEASVNAELKVSLAAKQLSLQISESKRFWIVFQEEFEEEVKAVKYYVDDVVLRQIWQKRTEHNKKYKSGENQDDEQFDIQRIKLETCLDQIKAAARAFTRTHPLSDPSNHDPKHVALEKIQETGDRVLHLAFKSMTSNIACADLVTHASDLETLVDAKGPHAKILHRFDKRETKKVTFGGEDKGTTTTESTSQEQETPGQETYGEDKSDEDNPVIIE
ncbi:hypothetical protein F5Y11DRAFT_173482 [Daldinia sp. FL1419]|nr:hypothetical protein F5Y11DRAFT_173482 [Daldinia sp. FL1419]